MTESEEMARKEKVELIENNIKEILKHNVESLVRKEELGTTLNFQAVQNIIENTFSLFKNVGTINFNEMPIQVLGSIAADTKRVLETFSALTNFNPTDPGEPKKRRDDLIVMFKDRYSEWYQRLAPIISYSANKPDILKDFEKNSKRIIADAVQGFKNELTKTQKDSKEIKEILETVKRAAGSVGVAAHSIHFQEQAQEHFDKAKNWFWGTSIIAILTLGFGVLSAFLLFKNVDLDTPADAIQYSIPKIILFSILYTATIWTGKLYKSHLHNYVINKHRQNALNTFETFVKASEGDQTIKNAILLQTTQAIFTPQNTGFIGQSEQAASPQILEIIRGVVGGKKQEG